jgi:hypothetical protein
MSLTSSQRAVLLETSKHPLFVLLISTLVGLIAIPYVGSRIAANRHREELRLAHAIEALNAGNETDRRLNQLLTEFENFVLDRPGMDAAARAALRERVYNVYAELNATAWWWYWPFLEKAELLGLVDTAGARETRAAIDEYATALRSSTKAIDPVWALHISSDTRAGGVDPGAQVATARAQLSQLQEQRRRALQRMIRPLLP